MPSRVFPIDVTSRSSPERNGKRILQLHNPQTSHSCKIMETTPTVPRLPNDTVQSLDHELDLSNRMWQQELVGANSAVAVPEEVLKVVHEHTQRVSGDRKGLWKTRESLVMRLPRTQGIVVERQVDKALGLPQHSPNTDKVTVITYTIYVISIQPPNPQLMEEQAFQCCMGDKVKNDSGCDY